ncbi:MAG TPA: ankyrin repeat domain-containing protein, partial [Pyrinomonadaceae bacterium]|nr:ankyrin repeat domain-containing protein [Pyrinomonadaceae bacterium]
SPRHRVAPSPLAASPRPRVPALPKAHEPENSPRNLIDFSLLCRLMSVVSLEFLRAAALGDINRLRAFLAQGVDINSTNKANQTALMLAAAFKHSEIVRFLLTAGANANCHDELGLTATDWAQQQTEIVQLINSAERLRGSQGHDAKPSPLTPPSPASAQKVDRPGSEELSSTILRANKRYAQTVATSQVPTAAAQALLQAENEETIDAPAPAAQNLNNDTTAVPRPAPVITLDHIPTIEVSSDPIIVDTTSLQTRSRAMKTLFRVSIVVFFLIAGFVSYHLATSLLSTRSANGVRPEPAPIPVKATKQPKSSPIVGGELAGAELFIPDPAYPRDATIEAANVTVGIQVSRKGIVVSAKALDGDETLRSAAEKAAKSSAFAPDKLQDKSSLINGTITYNFLKLSNSAQHVAESGFIADPGEVSATAGGPLAGAELKLAVPQISKSRPVEIESMTVVVRVSRTGKVVSWRPLDGDPHLRASVIKAARTSTFNPDKLPGDDDVVGIITYKFQ